MPDLPIPKPRDIGHPNPTITVARHELAIEEQRIVVESKELRLLEIGEEEARIQTDIEQHLSPEAERLDKAAVDEDARGRSTTDAYRARIKARQQGLLVRQRQLRLLELDDERTGIEFDLNASLTLIAKIEAEVSQQRALLRHEDTSNG